MKPRPADHRGSSRWWIIVLTAAAWVVLAPTSTLPTTMVGDGRAHGGAPASVLARAGGDSGDAEPAARLFIPIVSPEARRYAAPRFSQPAGLYDAPFRLAIDAPGGAVVRFTLDGSPPGPTHGRLYTAPIPVHTTTVVRALGYRPAGKIQPSSVATHSYLFPRDAAAQPALPLGLPATWGDMPDLPAAGPVRADYEMDPEVTRDPRYRDRMLDSLRALPSVSIATDPAGLFGAQRGIYVHSYSRGRDAERAASVEFLDPLSGARFNVGAGLRIAGVASRHHGMTLKKSFSLHFRDDYGSKRLDYPLFEGSAVTRFDTLRLRAGFNDAFSYVPDRAQLLRDPWARASHRAMGWVSPHGRFVHLYLNGLYWGVYDLSEEPTAAYAADHFGGREADYDVLRDATRGDEGIEDGSRASWDRLVALGERDLSERANYQQVRSLLDIDQHIDYTLLQIYGANQDWPITNWRAARNRVTGAGFQFFIWDFESSLDLLEPLHGRYDAERALDISGTAGVGGLHDALRRNAEYRLAFADRARLHLLDEGALSDQRSIQRYRDLARSIDLAMIGESARWGDAEVGLLSRATGGQAWARYEAQVGAGHPRTRDEEWAGERDRLLTQFFPDRARRVLWQLCDQVLYPPLAAPELDPPGGVAQPGLRVSMRPGEGGCAGARRDGAIYYTLDGSDPREPFSDDPAVPWSGRVSHRAQRYDPAAPPRFSGYGRVAARAAVVDRGRLIWSALTEAGFGLPRLVFSEVMYHPPDDAAGAEFIEILNLERVEVDLSGMVLEGVRYAFPPNSRLAPGARTLLVRDPEAFVRRHPDGIIGGVYAGSLSDGGETLALLTPDGQTLTRARYGDGDLWPLAADGVGFSLVPRHLETAADPRRAPSGALWPDDPADWRASAEPGGSPGRPDPPVTRPEVYVSEVLAHAALPLEDAVELFNAGDAPADIGGWFLSNDRRDPRRFRIPAGTVIPAGGYAVFYENLLRLGLPFVGQDPTEPLSLTGFGSGFHLAATGDAIYLSSADAAGRFDGLMTGFRFDATRVGASVGLIDAPSGAAVGPLADRSFGMDAPEDLGAFRQGPGGPNGREQVGPVVISEIMYHPAPGGAEFVELHNLGEAPIDLGAADDAWSFAEGIDFDFAPGSVMAAGGRALVVGMQPELFRGLYRIPPATPVFGPYAGKLSNGGEALVLARPFVPGEDPGAEAGGEEQAAIQAAARVPVDRIRYEDGAGWPAFADGQGASLERVVLDRYGDDPARWIALQPGGTPGEANTVPVRVYLPFAALR